MGLNEKFFRSADEDEGFFNTVLYDGTGVSNPITGVGFQPDLVWIKNRFASNSSHTLIDSVRGVSSSGTSYLHSNTTDDELFSTNMPSSLDLDGFTSEGNQIFTNKNGDDYVAWCWKAGGAAVSNTDGDITSQVSANVANGFSIVKWSGDNSNMDIGHGLNSAPEIVIRKSLNLLNSWAFDTSAVDGSWDYLFLNTTAAKANHSSISLPTSTTFNTSGTSYNSSSMIAYCFHSVAGVSKVGSYTGTGAVGKEIVTGFEPAFVMVKRTNGTGDWMMHDNKRSANNGDGQDLVLYANLNNSEDQYSSGGVVFNSDGFTLNVTVTSTNLNGGEYIYYAVA